MVLKDHGRRTSCEVSEVIDLMVMRQYWPNTRFGPEIEANRRQIRPKVLIISNLWYLLAFIESSTVEDHHTNYLQLEVYVSFWSVNATFSTQSLRPSFEFRHFATPWNPPKFFPFSNVVKIRRRQKKEQDARVPQWSFRHSNLLKVNVSKKSRIYSKYFLLLPNLKKKWKSNCV